MKPYADDRQTRPARAGDARGATDKLVIDGVVTHERLVQMIKERNPIIARRDDRSERATRS